MTTLGYEIRGKDGFYVQNQQKNAVTTPHNQRCPGFRWETT